jgi:hypothetical protein
MVKLKNETSGTQVFNLAHEQFCGTGPCHCSPTVTQDVSYTKGGQSGLKATRRRVPKVLTILAWGTAEVENAALRVPEVKEALARRLLSIVPEKPAAPEKAAAAPASAPSRAGGTEKSKGRRAASRGKEE